MSYSCAPLPLIWQCQRDLSSFSHSFHNLILSSNMQLVPSSPSAYQAGWLLQLSLCNPFSRVACNEYVHFEDLGEEGHRQSTLNSITRVKVNDSAQWSEAFSLLQIKSGCHSWQCRGSRRDHAGGRWCQAAPGSPRQIGLPGSPRPLTRLGWLGARGARALPMLGWVHGEDTAARERSVCQTFPTIAARAFTFSAALGWRRKKHEQPQTGGT